MISGWSKESSGGTGSERRGGTCLATSGRGRRCVNDTAATEGDGTWNRLHAALLADADATGPIDRNASADSTVNRVHQHATKLPCAAGDTGGPVHGTLSPARTPQTPRQQGRPARRLHEPAGCDTSRASDMSDCIEIPCFNRGAAELVIRAITRKYVASGRTSYALNLAYRWFNS